MKKKIFTPVIALFIALLVGQAWSIIDTDKYFVKTQTSVALIKEQSVCREDIICQQKTDSCYGAYLSQETALLKIINALLEEEVLYDAFQIRVSKEDIIMKSEWVDKNTKAPAILKCIKEKFGENQERYLQLYIKPTLVNPILHKEYNFSRILHQEKTTRIEGLKDSLDRTLKNLEGYNEYRKWEVPKEMAVPDELRKMYPETEELPFISQVLRNLKTGEIYSSIYEDEYTFMIPRLLKEDAQKWYIDGIVIQKRPFDEWFQEQVIKNVPVKILDAELLALIKQDYPALWYIAD